MSMCIVRAIDKNGGTAGYLWWGKLVSRPDGATLYNSPSAAKAAIKRAAGLAAGWEIKKLERKP